VNAVSPGVIETGWWPELARTLDGMIEHNFDRGRATIVYRSNTRLSG
jgi:hypothetical protein